VSHRPAPISPLVTVSQAYLDGVVADNKQLWTAANDLLTVLSSVLKGVSVRNVDEVCVMAERVLQSAVRYKPDDEVER
jgi:hypothetical protein